MQEPGPALLSTGGVVNGAPLLTIMESPAPSSQSSAAARAAALLDVLAVTPVAVGLTWMAGFARTTGAKMVSAEYLVLGLAIWAVYLVDRVLDGASAAPADRRARHELGRRWRWLLVAAALAAACVGTWVALHEVRTVVVRAGGRLALVVAGYFALTLLSRRRDTGHVAPVALGGLLVIGLMQGPVQAQALPQLWRGVLGGFFITLIYLTLRNPRQNAPAWILPRKAMGGWLFAFGCALAPHAHVEAWPSLLGGGEVLLFGVVCFLNSLLIRLTESTADTLEEQVLRRLFPGMLLTAVAGGVMQWWDADRLGRPHFAACAVAAILLTGLWIFRRRVPAALVPLLADLAVLAPGVAIVLTVPGR